MADPYKPLDMASVTAGTCPATPSDPASVDASEEAVREAWAVIRNAPFTGKWSEAALAEGTITAALATLWRENADLRADAWTVAWLVTSANRYLGISYTPSSVQCLDIANEFIAAVAQFAALAPRPTAEKDGDAL